MAKFIVVCSYCEKQLKSTEDESLETDVTSHGACSECYKELRHLVAEPDEKEQKVDEE